MKATMLKCYKITPVPRLLLGSETRRVRDTDERGLQASEMNFLRSMSGYRKKNTERNGEIRDKLNIFKFSEKA